jgi:hypothetical protein
MTVKGTTMDIRPALTTTVALYDNALGGTPDTQGKLRFHASPDAIARQAIVDGVTMLDTTSSQRDAAGYMLAPTYRPMLDRARGYALEFVVHILAETHGDSDKNGDGIGDRAGFSVIVLSADRKGIELGFWQDQIWAQEDGRAEPPDGTLFTHAEGAAFDTTRGLTRYTLTVQDDLYHLSSDGATILSGRLRDYTTFEGPVNPYRTPNFIFLGDDTGTAQAVVRLGSVGLMPSPAPA